MGINADNSLSNIHGFPSYQLVFGKNPNLSSVLTNKPPALDKLPISETTAANSNAMHKAREVFGHSESSEKLKRTLPHNILGLILGQNRIRHLDAALDLFFFFFRKLVFCTCIKILQKIMTFQKLAKTYFGKYLFIFQIL